MEQSWSNRESKFNDFSRLFKPLKVGINWKSLDVFLFRCYKENSENDETSHTLKPLLVSFAVT